jgi:hypothetical protein
MKKPRKPMLARREFLGTLGGGVIAAAGAPSREARALPPDYQDRRKPRYQANSPEVQSFYRVNRYPAK